MEQTKSIIYFLFQLRNKKKKIKRKIKCEFRGFNGRRKETFDMFTIEKSIDIAQETEEERKKRNNIHMRGETAHIIRSHDLYSDG